MASPADAPVVLLVACFFLGALTVPLAGGSLRRLGGPGRLRRPWALSVSLLLQVLAISVVPGADERLLVGAHLVSYAFSAAFLVWNRQLPGLWLVCLGGAMNLAVILANGGIMPATASALETAGHSLEVEEFSNSEVLADPELPFLGDVFAVPASVPLANVFSAGDVCVLLGGLLVLHELAGSRVMRKESTDRVRVALPALDRPL